VKVTRLTADRLKNVEMIVGRIKVSAPAMKDALLQIDFAILTQDKVEILKNAAPEPDEIEMFASTPLEDPANSAAPDIFYSEICKVP